MLIIVAVSLVILFFLYLTYNGLVTAKMRVSEAFAQIDVQLKRRTDLIPNLVETVKGYAKHEREIFEKVTKLRSDLVSAKSVSEKATANNQLSEALKSIFAIAENYPNLKASQNFLELQEELSDTENKIAYARQFYNSIVMNYNIKLKIFPNVLFVSILRFQPADFFQTPEEEKQAIKVSF